MIDESNFDNNISLDSYLILNEKFEKIESNYNDFWHEVSFIFDDYKNIVISWFQIKINEDVDSSVLLKIIFLLSNSSFDIFEELKKVNFVIPDNIINLLSNYLSAENLVGKSVTLDQLIKRRVILGIDVCNNWYDIYFSFHRSLELISYSLSLDLVFIFKFLMNFIPVEKFENIIINMEFFVVVGFLYKIESKVLLDFSKNIFNNYTLFCVLMVLFSFNGSKRDFNNDDNTLISNLLYKSTSDLVFFTDLMKIFNNYPSRYSELQIPLGLALSLTNSDHVLKIYFDALYIYGLSGDDNGRKCVAKCLEVFEANANNKNIVNKCWEIAFQTWSEWSFISNSQNYHFKPCFSIIDYGVVKHLVSSLTIEQVDCEICELFDYLQNLENVWHDSHSQYITCWYITISKLQIYYHTRAVLIDNSQNALQHGFMYEFDIFDEYTKFKLL